MEYTVVSLLERRGAGLGLLLHARGRKRGGAEGSAQRRWSWPEKYVVHIPIAQGYEEMSLDLEDYENKRVLILGRGKLVKLNICHHGGECNADCACAGNAGYETADHIVSSTAFIHMASRSGGHVILMWPSCDPHVTMSCNRSRIKFAYQTHYVGDVR